MREQHKDHNIDKYADDLATIKSMLMDVEKRPFLEFWAFYTWGGLIIIGTLIHYWLRISRDMPEPKLYLYVWLPLLLVAAFLETIAWLKQMSKESMPLFNTTSLKMFLTMGGQMIAVGLFLVISSKVTGYRYVPHIILVMYGVFLMNIAQMSHLFYYGMGYILVLVAVTFYILPIPKDMAYLLSGLVLGITFAVTGELTRRVEKGDQ